MRACVLLVAKAPVAGLAKTRLAAGLGDELAADLAAAALLDTLDAVEEVTTRSNRLVALTGDLGSAARGAEIRRRLADWQVVDQRGATFAERLVNAHHDAARLFGEREALVQIGMDTPQLRADDLRALAGSVDSHLGGEWDAALGPATDGGWWGLATAHVGYMYPVIDVPMSQPDTCASTRLALESAGARVGLVHTLADVDTADDAAAVAGEAPLTRFARRLAAATAGSIR